MYISLEQSSLTGFLGVAPSHLLQHNGQDRQVLVIHHAGEQRPRAVFQFCSNEQRGGTGGQGCSKAEGILMLLADASK